MSDTSSRKGQTTVTATQIAQAILGSRLAAAALAPAVVLWSIVAVQQALEGLLPLAAASAFAVLLTAAAAVGILRRAAFAYSPALVVCYAGAIWSAIWAPQAFQGLWIAAASGLAAALLLSSSRKAFLGLPAPGARPAGEHEKPDYMPVWLLENAESIIVAFIMALVIRSFCIEVFKIPSSSMEPTLLGDVGPDHKRENCSFRDYHGWDSGDRIMVTKYYYALNPIERFDVVVFKLPLNVMKNFIKRVVGLPDEEMFVYRGNIFTRPKGDNGKFRIARKPLRTQQSLWIRVGRTGLGDGAKFEDCWTPEYTDQAYEIVGGALRTLQYRDSSSQTDSKNIRFRRRSSDREAEISVSFDLELRDKTGMFFVDIPNEFGRFRMELRPDQPGVISGGPKNTSAYLRAPLQPGRRYHVEFLVYDGEALALIDGEEQARFSWCDFYDDLGDPAPTDALAFGSRDLLFTMADMRVGRDVYYMQRMSELPLEGPEHALPIPHDHYFMMGDNVANSHDSRAWKEEKFVLTPDAARRFGRPELRCESIDLRDGPNSADVAAREDWMKRTGAPKPPDHYIKGDEIGYERGFYDSDVVNGSDGKDERPAPFVHRSLIVGKALWIWWPPGRWGRLIR